MMIGNNFGSSVLIINGDCLLVSKDQYVLCDSGRISHIDLRDFTGFIVNRNPVVERPASIIDYSVGMIN